MRSPNAISSWRSEDPNIQFHLAAPHRCPYSFLEATQTNVIERCLSPRCLERHSVYSLTFLTVLISKERPQVTREEAEVLKEVHDSVRSSRRV